MTSPAGHKCQFAIIIGGLLCLFVSPTNKKRHPHDKSPRTAQSEDRLTAYLDIVPNSEPCAPHGSIEKGEMPYLFAYLCT